MAPHCAESNAIQSGRCPPHQSRKELQRAPPRGQKSAPPRLPENAGAIPRQPRDSASLSIIYCEGTILDSYKASQYGPRGFGGRKYRDLAVAGVESMADDAREKGDREQ